MCNGFERDGFVAGFVLTLWLCAFWRLSSVVYATPCFPSCIISASGLAQNGLELNETVWNALPVGSFMMIAMPSVCAARMGRAGCRSRFSSPKPAEIGLDPESLFCPSWVLRIICRHRWCGGRAWAGLGARAFWPRLWTPRRETCLPLGLPATSQVGAVRKRIQEQIVHVPFSHRGKRVSYGSSEGWKSTSSGDAERMIPSGR